MDGVLFLCTGNYYRSRFAEELFNSLAREKQLACTATSRGLRLNPSNAGPISRHTLAALAERNISVPIPVRWPCAVSACDFESARHVVAVKEAEHRELITKNFPQFLHQVEFWNVHDVDVAEPQSALPLLAQLVTQLANRLASA